MLQFLLSIIILIVPITVTSAVSSPYVHLNFINTEEGQTCKKNVLTWMSEVNKKLSSHLIPTDFIVNYNGEIEIDFYRFIHIRSTEVLEKIVFIANECKEPHFIHEYGHIVLDHLMRMASPAWRYSITWSVFNPASVEPKTIDEIKSEYIEQIRILKKINNKHREKIQETCLNKFSERQQNMSPNSDTKNICGKAPHEDNNLEVSPFTVLHQTGETIEKYEKFVDRLNEAQKIDNENPLDLHEFNLYFRKPNFSLRLNDPILPFHELFSDTLAVLILNDWSIIQEVTALDMKNKSHLKPNICHQPGLRKQEALLNYLNYRDFRKNLSVETYPYGAWEEENPYCQFAPIRSLIRDIMSHNPDLPPGDMIEALGMAIIYIFENEFVPSPENIQEWPSIDKNRALADGLIRQLNQKGWQPVLTTDSSH